MGKEFDALLVQTGQREVGVGSGRAAGGEEEPEEEKALQEEVGDDFPEQREFGPNLLVEPEDGVEKVFEKFLFSVSSRLQCREAGGETSADPPPPPAPFPPRRFDLRCRVMIDTLGACLCAGG